MVFSDRSAGGDGVISPLVTERTIIDSLPRAVIVTAVDGRILLWNRVAEQAYGWFESEVVDRNIFDLLVPDLETGQIEAMLATLVSGESWSGDFSVRRRDGLTMQVFAFERPVFDDDGELVAVVGASEDVTERRRVERTVAGLAEHLDLALDAGALGTWRWNLATGETIWDARLEALFGLEPGTFDGTFEAYQALLHPDDAPAVLARVDEAVQQKGSYAVEHRVVWPDGTVHWMQGKGAVTVDELGNVTGTIGCVADISEQVEAGLVRERAVAAALDAAAKERLSAQRLEFLGEINDVLATSSTRAEVMRNVTRAAVPKLGEWCSIYVLPNTGSVIPDVEIAHADPEMVAYANELQERFPYDPTAKSGIPHVIRTGESEFYPQIDEEVIGRSGATDEAAEVVRSLRLRSAIAVPLQKRGRTIGALQFVNTATSRVYTDDDLALARAIASRIASTIENRRLAEAQRTIATTLQASLLPSELPDIADLDVAVRYWAAGDGVVVGGDFYDVFAVDDHWAAVIGDVCGTGPAAAALTGLARHTLRASAWNGANSETVLQQLNHAIRRSGQQTFCTALFCTMTRTETGFHFAVTAGGHPLPIIVRSGGRRATLGEPGTLLGLLETTSSTTVSTELSRGDTVVLYTDGITDVRPPHGLTSDEIEDIVGRACTDARDADDVAVELRRSLDTRLEFSRRNDDIALLVLRVTDPC